MNEYITAHCHEGVDCEDCGSYVKIYPKNLTAGQVRTLVEFAQVVNRNPRREWHHLSRDGKSVLKKVDQNYNILVHRGFLKRREGTKGEYQQTGYGKMFVAGTASAPRTIYLLHNIVIGWSSDSVSIKCLLPVGFNLDDLMSQPIPELKIPRGLRRRGVATYRDIMDYQQQLMGRP